MRCTTHVVPPICCLAYSNAASVEGRSASWSVIVTAALAIIGLLVVLPLLVILKEAFAGGVKVWLATIGGLVGFLIHLLLKVNP